MRTPETSQPPGQPEPFPGSGSGVDLSKPRPWQRTHRAIAIVYRGMRLLFLGLLGIVYIVSFAILLLSSIAPSLVSSDVHGGALGIVLLMSAVSLAIHMARWLFQRE